MKGDEKLWAVLNDKLELLRASNRLPEAIRVGETLFDLAQRAFSPQDHAYGATLERLGQLYDQNGDRNAAKIYLVKAHDVFLKQEKRDPRAIFRSARRLAFLCDSLGQSGEAV